MMQNPPHIPSILPDEFLTRLVAELDDDTVRAIILHGSYARGDALPPYSDVDLVRITRETPDRKQEKRFIWHEGYLLNLSSRPLSTYREWLAIPQKVIFRISSIRDACILLDKDGAFRAFQQEACNWTWEPLQVSADAYASELMLEQTEIILKILKALHGPDVVALVEMIMLDLLSAVTEAIAVQRGILVRSGNSYLRQVQEVVGLNTDWTRYYMSIVGETTDTNSPLSIEEKGIASLRLYKETVQLLRPHLLPEHEATIEPLVSMIDHWLHKNIP